MEVEDVVVLGPVVEDVTVPAYSKNGGSCGSCGSHDYYRLVSYGTSQ